MEQKVHFIYKMVFYSTINSVSVIKCDAAGWNDFCAAPSGSRLNESVAEAAL